MQRVLRRDAKKRGLLYYFTGAKCIHGHLSRRLTSTGQCLRCLTIWRKSNADRINISRQKYNANNVEKNRAAKRRWRLDNPDKQLRATNEWSRRHPGRVLARGRKYAARHPDRIAIKTANRRAREAKAPGRFLLSDLKALIERSGDICFYCPADISYGKHTIDHFIPLSRGGSHWPENIRLACLSCNCSKGDKLPSEFQPERFERPAL
jgi:hypothetical protein